MRTLRKNTQKMQYSLQGNKVPLYEHDTDGSIKTVEVEGESIPVETGEYDFLYSEPQTFYANIAYSGGNAEAQEFGIDTSSYDAVLICERDICPISETSLIWVDSDVERKMDGRVEPKSADYKVVKVSHALNSTKYVLEQIVK